MRAIYRGDNKVYTLAFTDSNGSPIDITGWKVYFTMKEHLDYPDNEAAVKIDVTSHDDPTNGKTSIHLTNGQTDSLSPGAYWFDIQVKRAENDILTLTVGRIQVLADVTRRED